MNRHLFITSFFAGLAASLIINCILYQYTIVIIPWIIGFTMLSMNHTSRAIFVENTKTEIITRIALYAIQFFVLLSMYLFLDYHGIMITFFTCYSFAHTVRGFFILRSIEKEESDGISKRGISKS